MKNGTIKKLVKKYNLKANGFSFWPPYWINEPGVRSGLFAGKGSPEELQSEVDRIFDVYQDPINTSEAARYLMLRNGLGVECAGFIFHVMDNYLQTIGKGQLVDDLFVPKEELLKAADKESWKKHKELSSKEKESLPDNVPMAQVCAWFKREPQYITNVERLIDNSVVDPVDDLDNVQAGDLITLKSWSVYPHLGIVTEVSNSKVEYFSSDFDPVGPGGVTPHETTVEELANQESVEGFNGKLYTPAGVYRVRALNEPG